MGAECFLRILLLRGWGYHGGMGRHRVGVINLFCIVFVKLVRSPVGCSIPDYGCAFTH